MVNLKSNKVAVLQALLALCFILISWRISASAELDTETGDIKVSFSLFNISGYPISIKYNPEVPMSPVGGKYDISIDARVQFPGDILPIFLVNAYNSAYPFLKDTKGKFEPASGDGGKLSFSSGEYIYSLRPGSSIIFDDKGDLKKLSETSGAVSTFMRDAQNKISGWKTSVSDKNEELNGAIEWNNEGFISLIRAGSDYEFTYKNSLLSSILVNGLEEYAFEYNKEGFLVTFKEPSHYYEFEYYDDKKLRSINDLFGDTIYIEYSSSADNGEARYVYIWNLTQFIMTKYEYKENRVEITQTPIEGDEVILSGKIDKKTGARKSSSIAGDSTGIIPDSNGYLNINTAMKGFTPYQINNDAGNIVLKNKNGIEYFKEIINIKNDDFPKVASSIRFDGVIRDINSNITAVIYNGIVAEKYYYAQGATSPEKIITASGNEISFRYDNKGRIIESSDTIGRITSYKYTANGFDITYPGGNVSSFTNNEIGLPVQINDPLGRVTKLDYGSSLTPRSIELDGFDKQSVEIYPDEGIYAFESDLFGTWNFMENDDMSVTRIAPDDNMTQFEYIKDNLLLSILNEKDKQIATYSYNKDLQLAEALSEECRIAFEYDEYGRLAVKNYDKELSLRLSYDNSDMIKTVFDASGFTLKYSRNQGGLITEISSNKSGTFQISYYPSGLLKDIIYPNKIKITRTYDVAERIINYTISFPDGSLKETKLKYDSSGNLTESETNGNRIVFSYDQLGYLSNIADSKGKSLDIRFDKWGNLEELGKNKSKGKQIGKRSEINSVSLTYTDGAAVSSYDDGARKASVSYDWNNNIKRISFQDGAEISLSYEPVEWFPYRMLEGNKEKKFYYLYDRLYAVWESISKGFTRYIYLPNTDICLAVIRPDGNVQYALCDVLGSVTDLTDNKGKIIRSRTFNIFGSVTGNDALEIQTFYGGLFGLDQGNIVLTEEGAVFLKVMRLFSGKARMPGSLIPDYYNKLSFMENIPLKKFNDKTTIRPSGVNSRQL